MCRSKASQGGDASSGDELKESHNQSAPMPDRGATVPEVFAAESLIGRKLRPNLVGKTRVRDSVAVPTEAAAFRKLREDP